MSIFGIKPARIPALLFILVNACSATAPRDVPVESHRSPAATAAVLDNQKNILTNNIKWLNDNYPLAVEQARHLGRPLLIYMCAQWCRPCILMKRYVLSAESITPYAEKFVWLSIDTENQTNAHVLKLFPVQMWPSIFVVQPDSESILAFHGGVASADQFQSFLNRAHHEYSATSPVHPASE